MRKDKGNHCRVGGFKSLANTTAERQRQRELAHQQWHL